MAFSTIEGSFLDFTGHINHFLVLQIRWKPSMILKTKQQSAWSKVCWYVKVCIFWKCIQYTITVSKTQMLKNIPFGKINSTKMPSFFFRGLQLITVLLLIYDSYISSSTRFVSLKLGVGFYIFDSVSFLKSIFLSNKMHGLFGFKTS